VIYYHPRMPKYRLKLVRKTAKHVSHFSESLFCLTKLLIRAEVQHSKVMFEQRLNHSV
jgi:hypothetical protein